VQRLFRRIGPALLWRLGLTSVALALLDMVGIAILLPYLTLLSGAAPQPPAGVLAWLYATFSLSQRDFILLVTFAMMAFFVMKAVAAYFLNRVKFNAGAGITTGLSNELFKLLVNADYGYLAGQSVSQISGVINAETVHVAIWLDAVVAVLSEALLLCLILAAIFAVDVRLAVILVLTLGIISAVFYVGVLRGVAVHGEVQSEVRGRQYRFLFSVVSAIKDLKILGLEHAVQDEHRLLNQKYAAAVSAFNLFQTIPRSFLELIVMVSVPTVGLAAVYGAVDVKAAVPFLGFLAFCAVRLMPSYNRIVGGYSSYKFYRPSIVAIQNLFEDLGARQVVQQSRRLPFEGTLEIDGLTFSHAGKPVLKGVSLAVRRGTSVGLVGMSGAGKTTFLDILAGLREASAGSFKMDGKPFDPFRCDALRRLIGYVPQNVVLVDDTIAFNISFEESPDLARLEQVARIARIDDFIASLPDRLQTRVGEQGVCVSGGQKQRIGICRALYRDPSILIFDEATSALDNATERELSREIAALAGEKTLIIVAHRLSTVANCDVIHVFGGGVIVASGTHEALMSSSEQYRELYRGAGDISGTAETGPLVEARS
jgi:ABC-type multidrug transport system fused ATPase/permease subunit